MSKKIVIQKVVKVKRIKTKKSSKLCNLDGCDDKKHGRFDECKTHFIERHRKGSRFKWYPSEVGYETIIKMLECYPHVYNIKNIKLEHIKEKSLSHIPLSCNICDYEWTPRISDLINNGHGCPECSDCARYNLELFKKKMLDRPEINTSEVKEDHIKGKKSYVLVSCVVCTHKWSASIFSLVISKNGCPVCAKQEKYNLEVFRRKMVKKEKIDISGVVEEDIINSNSRVPVICKDCNHKWLPTINQLVNSSCGCPKCADRLPYTLEMFRERMLSKTNMSIINVKEEHIKGVSSKVPIRCLICNYYWEPSINNLITNNHGCPNCAGNAPYTLKLFLTKIKDRDDIDISRVKEKHIENCDSRVPIKCIKCNFKWRPKISSLIHDKSGCPKCKLSKAIRRIVKFLSNLEIEHELEKTFPNLKYVSRLRVDVYISSFPEIKLPVCIEYDGDYPGSHFKYTNEEEKKRHLETVKRDSIKDKYVNENNMHMIRIPYTCFNNLEEILENKLERLKGKRSPRLYLADEEVYSRRNIKLLEE